MKYENRKKECDENSKLRDMVIEDSGDSPPHKTNVEVLKRKKKQTDKFRKGRHKKFSGG